MEDASQKVPKWSELDNWHMEWYGVEGRYSRFDGPVDGDPAVCRLCGALVAYTESHDAYHEEQGY